MKKSFVIIAAALALLCTFNGCDRAPLISRPDSIPDSSTAFSNKAKVLETKDSSFPKSYMITSENYFDYQPGLECSAFASAYLLRHYGEKADGLSLYESFPARMSGGGVMPHGIEEFFNGRGYQAEFKSDGTVEILKELVSKGDPVIVFIHIQEPYESTHNTHYIPLIGYDEDYFYFAESLSEYANTINEKDVPYNRKTEIPKFKRLWSDIDSSWDYPYFVITRKESSE